MKKIGITGGIGSGKSTVSEYLIKEGYDIIDCDKIARDIVTPEFGLLKKLALIIGPEILNQDGTLNREKTSEIVFASDEKRKLLNDITHEAIRDIILQRFQNASSDPIFVDAALLFETGFADELDVIWMVKADESLRKKRVFERDETDIENIEARMNAQMDDGKKEKLADEIIDNSGSKEELFKHIEELLKKYA